QEVLAPEEDLAGDPRLALGHQAHDREEAHALAGAGLPHHPEGLAGRHGERGPVYGLHHAILGRELDLQVLDLELRFSHAGPPLPSRSGPEDRAHHSLPTSFWCGSSASRRPSPRKFTQRTVMRIASPGNQT